MQYENKDSTKWRCYQSSFVEAVLKCFLGSMQTQNSVSPDKGKGLSYINHAKDKRKILIFVREKNEDENGNTMAFVFLGEGKLIEHYGSKPMSIKWELLQPMPPYLWMGAAKMEVG